MYRLFTLFAILAIAETTCHGRTCRHHHNYSRRCDRLLNDLAKEVIKADQRTREYCRDNNNDKTKEIYDPEEYKLIVPLAEYKEEDVTVKTKHRVVGINARKSGGRYSEVRVLPEIVDVGKATWVYGNGELVIMVPYRKTPSIESEKGCGEINEAVVTVPKSATGEFTFDVRFSDGNDTVTDVNDDKKHAATGSDKEHVVSGNVV